MVPRQVESPPPPHRATSHLEENSEGLDDPEYDDTFVLEYTDRGDQSSEHAAEEGGGPEAVTEEGVREGGKKKKRKRIKLRKGITIPRYGEITWKGARHETGRWLRDPLNVALVLWCVVAFIACAILFFLEIGVLNSEVPDETTRAIYIDNITQVVNALFVLMNAIWQPLFVWHLYQLWRYNPIDIQALRQYYCRGGGQKPHERFHMVALNVLLHLTCLSMYALAIIYWVYSRTTRPKSAVLITIVLAYVTPILAFLYFILCPLQGSAHKVDGADPGTRQETTTDPVHFEENRLLFLRHGTVVTDPHWHGSVVGGACLNPRVALFTFLFPCLMFGFMSQRLGFGSWLLQAITFLLVVVGPWLVFELSAHEVEDVHSKQMMVAMGMGLAWMGLSYGALWRSKMRSTFGLPSSRMWCWSGHLTDCCTWLCCPWCALCQEFRTVEYYQVAAADGDTVSIQVDESCSVSASQESAVSHAALNASSVNANLELQRMSRSPLHSQDPMTAPRVVLRQEGGEEEDNIEGTPGRQGFVRLEMD